MSDIIKAKKKIVILTGAGISTESGIPDFRSPGGLWSIYRTVTIQEFLANEEDRKYYWQYKRESYKNIVKANPNDGHNALVTLEKKGKLQCLITQNIDGLHQIAGNSSNLILELHGTDRQVICLKCSKLYNRDEIQAHLERSDDVPVCDDCGGWLKPATVSFGQNLQPQIIEQAMYESEHCDAFLVIGSSLTVHPAALLPEHAKRSGAWLGILNGDPTPLDSFSDWVCHDPAGQVLQKAINITI